MHRLMRVRAHVTWIALAVLPACDKKSEPSPESVAITASAGSARVEVGEHGFSPSSLTIPKGAPGSTVAVTFVRSTDDTCAKEVVFPDLGIKKDLPLNEPVIIDLPTDASRTLTFQCGMAMYKGALVVR
jgi:plastocyanin domain-containing protein